MSTDGRNTKGASPPRDPERIAREAAALRENLKKRKAQKAALKRPPVADGDGANGGD